MLADFENSLNIFLLTFDYKNKSTFEIFNEWSHASKMVIPQKDVVPFLEFIDSAKDVAVSSLLVAAENSLIPKITRYNLKERII